MVPISYSPKSPLNLYIRYTRSGGDSIRQVLRAFCTHNPTKKAPPPPYLTNSIKAMVNIEVYLA